MLDERPKLKIADTGDDDSPASDKAKPTDASPLAAHDAAIREGVARLVSRVRGCRPL